MTVWLFISWPLKRWFLTEDLADELDNVDFEEDDHKDDEGWETEDEMEAEAEQDDSELTFSKHTGDDGGSSSSCWRLSSSALAVLAAVV